MAKSKVSLTVDAAKVARARKLLAVASLSQLVDVALDRLIEDELEQRHAEGYRRRPPGADDDAWAEVRREASDVADDVDWAQLYGAPQS